MSKQARLRAVSPETISDISLGGHLVFFTGKGSLDSTQLRRLADILDDKDIPDKSTIKQVLQMLLEKESR